MEPARATGRRVTRQASRRPPKYSALALLRHGLSGKQWPRAWRDHPLAASYDVVIIGAGVHGLAAAYYLAANHGITNVAVLDKSYLGGGGSGRSTAILRSNYLTPEGVRFYDRSMDLYRTLAAEVALVEHRHAGDPVIGRQVVGGGQAVHAGTDDDDVVAVAQRVVAPGARPLFPGQPVAQQRQRGVSGGPAVRLAGHPAAGRAGWFHGVPPGCGRPPAGRSRLHRTA